MLETQISPVLGLTLIQLVEVVGIVTTDRIHSKITTAVICCDVINRSLIASLMYQYTIRDPTTWIAKT